MRVPIGLQQKSAEDSLGSSPDGSISEPSSEDMPQRITRVRADLEQLEGFYNIQVSPTRKKRFREYYTEELDNLNSTVRFSDLDQENRVDYVLLQSYLKRQLEQLHFDEKQDVAMQALLPFADSVVRLCERRQMALAEPVEAKEVAEGIYQIGTKVQTVREKLERGDDSVKIEQYLAFRAAMNVDRLRGHLEEWFGFYDGYDPMFSWWVNEPYGKTRKDLEELSLVIREKLIGIKPGDNDVIIGQPIGREGLAADLKLEKILYTPEELIEIGENEYKWCEAEMIQAAQDLDKGSDWRAALEEVKNQYSPPGRQPRLVHSLAKEATDYAQNHDLVTIPRIASETWRTFMLSPQEQKIAPFFLGGRDMQISYPTSSMSHLDKLMSLRGNNVFFSRATVFHEMIPGHRLQSYMKARHRPYRNLFTTPFWTEGWSLYWEMILWDKGYFHRDPSAENRIGTLFWRMHRCARIVFSLKFHLGQWTPQQCIDYLVDKVGHERATAEGEVRRSLNGDYRPLYQAGYMLGALQLYALRGELVATGKMTEKQFHDRVLRENEMPIEILRALLERLPLKPEYEATWRFYNGIEETRKDVRSKKAGSDLQQKKRA